MAKRRRPSKSERNGDRNGSYGSGVPTGEPAERREEKDADALKAGASGVSSFDGPETQLPGAPSPFLPDHDELREVFQAHPEPKRRAWLTAYSLSGSAKVACEAAGVHFGAHYHWRKIDPLFVEMETKARDMATDLLEAAAYKRARDGVATVKWYKDKPLTLHNPKTGRDELYVEHKHSDQLAKFMLEGQRPNVYRQRSNQPQISAQSVQIVLPDNGRGDGPPLDVLSEPTDNGEPE